MPDTKPKSKTSIADVTLTTDNAAFDAGLIRRDFDTAIRDLKQGSLFHPKGDKNGPYTLELSMQENKLVFHIQNAKGEDLPYLVVSLSPYRRLIKDYFMIVRSYDDAMREGKPSKIEAIDMGRRGLHNEGAELLQDRLNEKIALDFDTARRLFTLICVLHSGKIHILR